MNIPKGMTEEEVVATITKIASRLAPKFRFGYHDIDDIKQHAFLCGMTALDKYDGKRPLENFLWIVIRNKLKNLKRDKYGRPNTSCKNCKWNAYDKELGCTKHDDVLSCKSYASWYYRNETKKNLMAPMELGEVRDVHEDHMKVVEEAGDIIINQELKGIIDTNLPIALRADYLRMLSNVHVPKPKRVKIQETIRQILLENGYDDEETR